MCCTGSGADEACSITVWRKNVDITAVEKKANEANYQAQTAAWVLVFKFIMRSCFLIMALVFLWQNRAGSMGI